LSLRSELSSLFDTRILRRADRLRPTEVNALAVQEAAGALLRLKGEPDRQVELVKGLAPETAAALCRWLADPSFWSLVAGVTRH
jgi:hypothetical protein